MSKTLVIAEKPSVATDLAKALGREEGRRLLRERPLRHLLGRRPPARARRRPRARASKRGKWKIENLPHLPPEFALAPIEKNASRLDAAAASCSSARTSSAIINACDAGREGELIFRNIIKATGAKQPIQRLWLQSMTPESIRTAFQQLRSDEEMRPLADAARLAAARRTGWSGINSTRALTAFNSQGGGFQQDHRRPRADADAGDPRRARGENPRLRAARLI